MIKEKIINIIIEALQKSDVLEGFHKLQNDKAVQIKIRDGTYLNICIALLNKEESFIVEKLR